MKNNNLYYKILPFLFFAFIGVPMAALAAGLVPCNGPDCDFSSLATLVNNIINWFLGISVSVAAITFAIAGGEMLFNPGNTVKIEEALGMFKKTIIGILIVLCAWLIIHTVIAALVNSSTGALRFLGS